MLKVYFLLLELCQTEQDQIVQAIVDALQSDNVVGTRVALTKMVEDGSIDSKTVKVRK